MKSRTELLLTILGLVFALSAVADENWQRIFTCDQDSAYLEAASSDRRTLQFVITNKNIVKYLTENSWMKSPWDNPNVLVISGNSPQGVFFKGDFHSLQQNQGEPYPGYTDSAVVERKASSVEIHFYLTDQHSETPGTTEFPGNWIFRDCQ